MTGGTALTIVDGTSLMEIEEREWGREKIDLYKATVCKGASDLDFAYFLAVARRTGLEPGRQIYSVPYGNQRVIQTGIEGLRLIADRTGEYAGSDPPVYTPDDGDEPRLCTVTVWRLKDGERRAFAHTARYSEFKRDTTIWRSMPWHMLAIAAERHALKKAFPQELADFADRDEPLSEGAFAGPPRAIQPPAQPIEVTRPPVGGSLRRLGRTLAAGSAPPAPPITVDEDGVVIEPDAAALMEEITALRSPQFNPEIYLHKKHPNRQLDELTLTELTVMVEAGRRFAPQG